MKAEILVAIQSSSLLFRAPIQRDVRRPFLLTAFPAFLHIRAATSSFIRFTKLRYFSTMLLSAISNGVGSKFAPQLISRKWLTFHVSKTVHAGRSAIVADLTETTPSLFCSVFAMRS